MSHSESLKIEIITDVGFCPKGCKNLIWSGEQIEKELSFQSYPSCYDEKINGKAFICRDLIMDNFANITLKVDCGQTVLAPNEYKIICGTNFQKVIKLFGSDPNWISIPVAVLALIVSIFK